MLSKDQLHLLEMHGMELAEELKKAEEKVSELKRKRCAVQVLLDLYETETRRVISEETSGLTPVDAASDSQHSPDQLS